MVALDAIGRRYGVRPSQLVGEPDKFAAYSIDLHAHNWGVQQQNLDAKLAARRPRGGRGKG